MPVVTGGKRHAIGGTFFEPTVLTDVPPGAKVAQEGTFGPLALSSDSQQMRKRFARLTTRSSVSPDIYSRDIGRVWRVAERLESGMVGINTGLISTEVAPFGGLKAIELGPGRFSLWDPRIYRGEIPQCWRAGTGECCSSRGSNARS